MQHYRLGVVVLFILGLTGCQAWRVQDFEGLDATAALPNQSEPGKVQIRYWDNVAYILKCADVVHSFCMKDHRDWPIDQDCGPGWGEIDHYRLLHPVAWTGRLMPLCCENIFRPLLPRPSDPAAIDRLATTVRAYLETVIAGLHTLPTP